MGEETAPLVSLVTDQYWPVPLSPSPRCSGFRREEWAAPGDGGLCSLFRRWQVARHAWVEAHPDSELGDMLDVLRGEVQVKRGSWEWVRDGDAPETGCGDADSA